MYKYTQPTAFQQHHRMMNSNELAMKMNRPAGGSNTFPVAQWQHYIEQEIGFVLPAEQIQWLINAVSRTATDNDLSIEQLWLAVQKDRALSQQLIDTVLIPESRFFRHLPSIQFVTSLAMAAERNEQSTLDGDQIFRVWSVGCSVGQEVWSLAMCMAAKKLRNYHILGTDVSQQALTFARAGEYDGRQQQLIPPTCQAFIEPLTLRQSTNSHSTDAPLSGKHIGQHETFKDQPDASSQGGTTLSRWRVSTLLRKHVDFAWHNIFTPTMPTNHLQQVIICQNVLIYFRQFDQRDILNRLAAQCAVGGYIILAPGEGLFWHPKNMRRLNHVQVNGWQKIAP